MLADFRCRGGTTVVLSSPKRRNVQAEETAIILVDFQANFTPPKAPGQPAQKGWQPKGVRQDQVSTATSSW